MGGLYSKWRIRLTVGIMSGMTNAANSHTDPMTRLTPAFLEEVLGEDALKWVRARNAVTEAALQENPGLSVADLEAELLAILDNPDRIPMVKVRGPWAYNFWTDDANPRGLWRRQKLAHYLGGGDRWEVLIDVDALAKKEGKSWVWHGASVCPPDFDRALITLSDGGSDADETREFDLATMDWVEGGFYRPESKGSLVWITPDLCWLSQPLGPESTSASGYPLQVRLLRRGQTSQESELILSGPSSAMGVWVGVNRDRSGMRSLVQVSHDFYTSETYLLSGKADSYSPSSPVKIPLPDTSEIFVWDQWVCVWLREDWDHGGARHPSGALLALNLDQVVADLQSAPVTTLFTPSAHEVLEAITTTLDHIVLTTIRDVVSTATVLSPPVGDGANADGAGVPWGRRELPSASGPLSASVPRDLGEPAKPAEPASDIVTISVSAVDATSDNRLWMVTTGYTQPSTLWLVDLDASPHTSPTLVRQSPSLFDATGVEVSQHFATSEDGTSVPYFQVRKVDSPLPSPTLLYGYGGFDVSLLPAYAPGVGKAWLERGGTYVVANIRGGGEYGPTWHRAALKENRHRAYEDFVAVARDLVARGVTTPAQLGAQGGSNGGLLMGNMYTQFPGDFGAILCQVPLLDMGRYHTLLAGHSWVAEYGDPTDPLQWDYIRTFSPVHLFDEAADYPALMITTSTKDDRVHPGHARSLGYLAENAGKEVLYFENIEGGHGGAADNAQRAHNQALGWAFLWGELGV